jgi:hypothetical protein
MHSATAVGEHKQIDSPVITTSRVKRLNNKRLRLLTGLFLAIGLLIQYHHASSQYADSNTLLAAEAQANPKLNIAYASPFIETSVVTESLEDFARCDPMGFIQKALDRYDSNVRDYTFTF